VTQQLFKPWPSRAGRPTVTNNFPKREKISAAELCQILRIVTV